MKKKCATKKKYGYGSSGVGSNYIENPATTIAKGDIMNAEAERKAANNPWIPITLMAGQLASTAISAGAGKSGAKTGATDFTVTGQDTAINIPNEGMSPIQQQFVNAMGNSNAQGNVEVEGKEVIETPAGEVAEVEGASHEQGGVNMNVPEGTKIYSKRIEKFGETMAERKIARERKLTNLNKLLENSKGDIAVKNAHARSIEALNEQEQADLQTQEMYGVIAAVHEFAFGTDENGVRKYGGGTGPGGIEYDEFGNPIIKDLLQSQMITPGVVGTAKSVNKKYATVQNKPEAPDYMKNLQSSPVLSFANNFGETLPENKDYGAGEFIKGFDKGEPDTISLTDEEVLNKGGKYDGYSNPELAPEETSIDKPGSVASRFIDGAGKFVDKSGFKMPGTGDLIGLAGDAISAFAPMKNTLENRAGDTPNINAFKDFGKDALEANLAAMEMSAGQKAEALRKITASANGAKRIGRNSARGINQMRALDLATDINSNEANQGAVDSFQRTMQELLGQKAGLENQQDQMVMNGEQERDLNDRKDRDNFYTQLGKDKSTMGEGVQHIGKDLNAIKQNDMMTNVINQLSKYGLAFDEKGNLIEKPKTT
ncbi:hypothetical protein [Flavobacterium phage FpV4]|uniref:Uncharacterized protein n=2 Tax=Fipvunavirus Fpv4 TaxID=2560476 RepID=A0A1B0WKX5_9CAUD|nr:hypothetical protein BOW80_gp30 [Flavobacterium phage Fpv3]YP_009594086.1 hypothetical protein FDG89_gp30 [Flavobacterium phage FpV4]ALN97143.1 hypothetical protein [Flavobacterium phage FpV4]ANB40432.1 hypothetical protein [Flavobacterium phage Fpv3]